MKVVIAIDSLKGSLSSLDAGNAIKEGIRHVVPEADVIVRPLADGGEGTVEALVSGLDGHLETVKVKGPLGNPVKSTYGILENNTAVMEMASAAGITLVSDTKRNPLYTTSYGVGEMIKDAISKGCRKFIVGIGGSATNDGGIGMLQALGYQFLDADGNDVPLGGIGLSKIQTIRNDKVIPELKECSFKIACDVNNPLCGELGSSRVFGPQKGATEEMILQLDSWLDRYANLSKQVNPNADPKYPGTGAAGGLGFAFLTYTNAILQSGIQIILEETKLESYIKNADVVITGEGRMDEQTAMGKAPIGVAKLAKKFHKTVIAFAGCVTRDAIACNAEGIDAIFPIVRRATTLSEAMDPINAKNNMMDTVEQVFRLYKQVKEG